jgi:hypothetical protein
MPSSRRRWLIDHVIAGGVGRDDPGAPRGMRYCVAGSLLASPCKGRWVRAYARSRRGFVGFTRVVHLLDPNPTVTGDKPPRHLPLQGRQGSPYQRGVLIITAAVTRAPRPTAKHHRKAVSYITRRAESSRPTMKRCNHVVCAPTQASLVQRKPLAPRQTSISHFTGETP